MQKRFTLILIVAFLNTVNAQSKKEPITESTLNYLTGLYYAQSNWNALIILEPSIKISETKNAVIYNRLGQAFYFSNQLTTAEKYFKIAYELNPDENTLYFYYYSIYFQGYTQEANQLKNKMSAKLVETIEKETPVSILESVGLEGGVKVLHENTVGGNLIDGSINTNWNLSNSLKLNVAFTFMSQSLNLEDLTQPEIYIALPYIIGDGWNFTPLYHGVFNTKKKQADVNNTVQKTNITFIQGNLNKRIEHFNVGINFGKHVSNATTTTNTTSTPTSYSSSQLGVSASYTFKIGKSIYYTLNPNFAYLSENVYNSISTGYAFNINGILNWEKWSLNTSYLTKSDLLFGENYGFYYLNPSGKIDYRFSLSLSRAINKHFSSNITYQNEQQTSRVTIPLHYNSFFLSLKYTF